MTDKEQIEEIYKNLSKASIDKDINLLNSILADDYILVHMTGMQQTKEDYINSVVNEELIYYEAIHEKIDIEINRNKAKVIGKTKTLASPFGMSKNWWRLKQKMYLEKTDDKWIIKKSIASTY